MSSDLGVKKSAEVRKHLAHGTAVPLERGWRLWVAGCALGLALSAGAVHATPIPFEDRQVDMTVREQPIAAFLQDFFGTMDVPVSVSSNVKGAVNGVFRGPTERVFSNIQKSFGLMAYYDGSVVHIYTPNEVTTRTFANPVELPAVAVTISATQPPVQDSAVVTCALAAISCPPSSAASWVRAYSLAVICTPGLKPARSIPYTRRFCDSAGQLKR